MTTRLRLGRGATIGRTGLRAGGKVGPYYVSTGKSGTRAYGRLGPVRTYTTIGRRKAAKAHTAHPVAAAVFWIVVAAAIIAAVL